MPERKRLERASLPYDEAKVTAQLKELSIEEKVSLLAGSGFATTTPVPRLNIPLMKLAEGVNGVKDAMAIDSGDTVTDVLAGGGPKTVCFPSTSCFGATWNVELMEKLGQALGSQAREKNIATIMGPGVNLHRDPRGGRNFEYFSEDPYLTGRLAAGLINGIQHQGVGACAKHFVANDAENHRRSYNVVDPTGGVALRELYLAAFEKLLVHSNPVAIMTSYNKVEGTYTSETPLLEQVIRGEWGFDGAIQSDWFGTVSTAPSILAGQDLEMPGPPIFRGARLLKAVQEGQVPEEVINVRARKMLEWIGRVSSPERPPAFTTEEAASVARQVASEGTVLLKNDRDSLPLDLTQRTKIAVVGLPALDPPTGGGGSSLAPAPYVLTPLECLRAAHCAPDLVRFAGGVRCNMVLPVVPPELIAAGNGERGIDVTYYNNRSPGSPVFKETLSHGQVVMLGSLRPGLDEAGFWYEITTTLTPTVSGKHHIGVQSTGGFELFVDGSEVTSAGSPNCNAEDFLFTPGKLETSCSYSMVSGKSYSIKLVVKSWVSEIQRPDEPSPHIARLCFEYEYNDEERIAQAASIAADSDISIVFAGRNAEYEGEGSDMADIGLPGNQVELVKAVAGVCKRTIVVLYSGNPMDISPFVDSIDALVHAHYLGQEGGAAITDILTGKVNPSGRLATTWPKRLEDTGSYRHFPAVKGDDGSINIRLEEGLEVGYRGSSTSPRPLFPFGFGLSYTSFRFDELIVTPSEVVDINETNKVLVKVTVTNTGKRAGAEVVQVYARPIESAVPRPKALKGFAKVEISPGSSTVVEVELDVQKAFGHWDSTQAMWRVAKGTYGVCVGSMEESVVVE